jgi:hypothetical protein
MQWSWIRSTAFRSVVSKDSNFFLKADPDPPHGSALFWEAGSGFAPKQNVGSGSASKLKFRSYYGSKPWRPADARKRGADAQSGALEGLFNVSHVLDHFDEEQDPDPLRNERSDPDPNTGSDAVLSPCLHGSRWGWSRTRSCTPRSHTVNPTVKRSLAHCKFHKN